MRQLSVGRDIKGIAFTPAGRLLGVAAVSGGVHFWDAAAGKERLHAEFWEIGSSPSTPLAFSPDGRLVIYGSYLLDLAPAWERLNAPRPRRGRLFLSSAIPFDPCTCLAFSGDGRLVVAASLAKLEVWDLPGRRCLLSQGGLWRYCAGVALAPDGRLLAVRSDPAMPLLDVRTGQVLATLEHPQRPSLSAFSPDGRLLATATGASRRVWLWDVEGRHCLTKLRAFRQAPEALAFHPGGRLLAAGPTDGLIRLWDTTTFREVAALDWKVGPIRALAFAPDGMTAAAAGDKGAVVVWDVDEA
jgi:WD40 repeat protein